MHITPHIAALIDTLIPWCLVVFGLHFIGYYRAMVKVCKGIEAFRFTEDKVSADAGAWAVQNMSVYVSPWAFFRSFVISITMLVATVSFYYSIVSP